MYNTHVQYTCTKKEYKKKVHVHLSEHNHVHEFGWGLTSKEGRRKLKFNPKPNILQSNAHALELTKALVSE